MKKHEIKSILEHQLNESMTAHERERRDRHRTGEALVKAIQRYKRFVVHGAIPKDLSLHRGAPSTLTDLSHAGAARKGVLHGSVERDQNA